MKPLTSKAARRAAKAAWRFTATHPGQSRQPTPAPSLPKSPAGSAGPTTALAPPPGSKPDGRCGTQQHPAVLTVPCLPMAKRRPGQADAGTTAVLTPLGAGIAKPLATPLPPRRGYQHQEAATWSPATGDEACLSAAACPCPRRSGLPASICPNIRSKCRFIADIGLSVPSLSLFGLKRCLGSCLNGSLL